MSRDNEVREILEKFKQKCLMCKMEPLGAKKDCSKCKDQTLSQLNALYKSKVDEKKLIEILKPDEYNFIEGGTNLRGEHFIYLDIKKLAHAITQKASEVIKYE